MLASRRGWRGRLGPTSTTHTGSDGNHYLGKEVDMTTEGIEAVFLETHNWGKAAKFLQALGFELEFSTGHNSGQLRNGSGPYVFLAEVPEDRKPGVQIVLKVTDAGAVSIDPSVEVVTPFEDTHYGTREMTVRDPDGRLWSLQAPVKN
jgi:hypothetical protein